MLVTRDMEKVESIICKLCKCAKYGAVLLLAVCATACNSSTSTKVKSSYEEISPIWADEFDSDGLPSSSNWTYDVGDGCPHICGWGNNELQYYTEADTDNARVENGHLIIEARKEPIGDMPYTSARLVTRGLQDWQYGTVEVKALLPTGLGAWPAIWMLPTESKYGGWPGSGEIDIMEHVGYYRDSIFGTVHTEAFNHMIGTQDGGGLQMKDVDQHWHVYKIVWDQQKIDWYLDDVHYHTFTNRNMTSKEWPFDNAFHLILNIAVGGSFGGAQGVDEDIWPQRMLVDYVRVYQLRNDN